MASKAKNTMEVPTTISEITASLTAWSAQSVEVNAYGGGDAHGEPYVVVRVGTTLTYCYDRQSLSSFASAWMEAEGTARGLQLARRLPPPTWLSERGQYVAVSAVVRGPQPVRVTGVSNGASPNGYAHVAVKVGRIGVLAYDPDSVRSYVTAWTQALDLSGTFGPGGDAFAALVRHKFERSRM